jgi:ribosomal protein L11 methyltransferase
LATSGPDTWRLALSAPAAARERFAALLEPFTNSIAIAEPDARGASLIEAIATGAPDRAFLQARIALLSASLGVPEPLIAVEFLPEQDWLAVSKREFAPFRVGRFFIHGSDYGGRPPGGLLPLCIDAGMAFGTGRHGSTQGCLLALQAVARSRRCENGLDLGCGSGILSLAAARLWQAEILACDIDMEAVVATRAAVAKNGLNARIRSCWADGLARRIVAERAPFDLITANLIPRPLIALSRDLARSLAPGGVAILSGMAEFETPPVERRYRELGLRSLGRVEANGWRTLIFEKPGRDRRASRLVPVRAHA